jgi:hypothetical protein
VSRAKHWRVREDKDGWWQLGYNEGGAAGIFHVRGRLFGRDLAESVADFLRREETARLAGHETEGQ